ncbi:MAG: DUF7793 family protein [Bacteroidia bacterium]
MSYINLPYATLHYEDPIVYIVFREKAQLGFIEIRELNNWAEKLSNGRPYFTLSRVPMDLDITPMGKRLAGDIKEAPLCKGTAIVVKKDIVMYAANFFHAFKKTRFHFKAFTEEKEAVDWLLNLNGNSGQIPARQAS